MSNADPRVTLRLLGEEVDDGWRAQVESIPITGCTVKLNMLLRELPNFTARPGLNEAHHAGQINTPLSKQAWRDGFAAARRGELPERLWTEQYFQTVHDPDGRAGWPADDERLRAVRARTRSPRAIGMRAARRSNSWPSPPSGAM